MEFQKDSSNPEGEGGRGEGYEAQLCNVMIHVKRDVCTLKRTSRTTLTKPCTKEGSSSTSIPGRALPVLQKAKIVRSV